DRDAGYLTATPSLGQSAQWLLPSAGKPHQVVVARDGRGGVEAQDGDGEVVVSRCHSAVSHEGQGLVQGLVECPHEVTVWVSTGRGEVGFEHVTHAVKQARVGIVKADLAVASPSGTGRERRVDRKSTRLDSSHVKISYAVFGVVQNIRAA